MVKNLALNREACIVTHCVSIINVTKRTMFIAKDVIQSNLGIMNFVEIKKSKMPSCSVFRLSLLSYRLVVEQ